ncbi:MAG: FkbM family methyltransferase [Sphingomonas bacterium]
MLIPEKLSYFLYRRLAAAGLVRCRLAKDDQTIWLSDKYQVASFQDVFLDPNYWRAFQIFDADPELVVDCGAHCGHFAILVDMCFRAKFGHSAAEYILIEPNEALHPAIHTNLVNARMRDRARILTGLVGRKQGRATLTTNPKNYLVSQIGDGSGPGKAIQYLDLAELTGDRPIDLLKLDIEGSEFEFIQANPDVLARTRNAVVEVHHQVGSLEDFCRIVASSGLKQNGPVIGGRDNVMTWFAQEPAPAGKREALAALAGC